MRRRPARAPRARRRCPRRWLGGTGGPRRGRAASPPTSAPVPRRRPGGRGCSTAAPTDARPPSTPRAAGTQPTVPTHWARCRHSTRSIALALAAAQPGIEDRAEEFGVGCGQQACGQDHLRQRANAVTEAFPRPAAGQDEFGEYPALRAPTAACWTMPPAPRRGDGPPRRPGVAPVRLTRGPESGAGPTAGQGRRADPRRRSQQPGTAEVRACSCRCSTRCRTSPGGRRSRCRSCPSRCTCTRRLPEGGPSGRPCCRR